MKTLLILVLGHIAGITLLLWIGWSLNELINQYANKYAGIITVLSSAFGIYSFVVSLLYHRNRRFHFWVNRIRLTLSRTHTYWQPSFDLELSEESASNRPQLLDSIWTALSGGRFGRTKKIGQTPTTLSIEIDDVMCMVFRFHDDDDCLHAHLDRKLLVPSHLYDTYRHKLARLAEELRRLVNPVEMRYGLIVSFGDGVANPYYGFFVNQVPAELLQDFHVAFRPDTESTSRIEAEKDRVSIEGSSHVDFFEALAQVLSLRAVPGGVST